MIVSYDSLSKIYNVYIRVFVARILKQRGGKLASAPERIERDARPAMTVRTEAYTERQARRSIKSDIDVLPGGTHTGAGRKVDADGALAAQRGAFQWLCVVVGEWYG